MCLTNSSIADATAPLCKVLHQMLAMMFSSTFPRRKFPFPGREFLGDLILQDSPPLFLSALKLYYPSCLPSSSLPSLHPQLEYWTTKWKTYKRDCASPTQNVTSSIPYSLTFPQRVFPPRYTAWRRGKPHTRLKQKHGIALSLFELTIFFQMGEKLL